MNGKLKVLAKCFFSFAVLAVLFASADSEELVATLAEFSFPFLLIILPLFAADRWLMSWKWTFLLRPLSIQLRKYVAFKTYYISSFFGYLIPFGIGPDLVRFFRIKKQGYSGEKVIASIIVERLLGIVANILMLFVSVLLLLGLAFRVDFIRDVIFLTFIIATFSFSILYLLFSERSWLLLSRLRFINSWIERIGYANFHTNLMQIRKFKLLLLAFIGLSFLEQFFPVMITYFTARAVAIPLSPIACLAFVPIATFLQRLPFSFMGLGVREGSYILFLKFLGINAGSALGLSMLLFAIEIFFLTPAAFWSALDQFQMEGLRRGEG